jgi:hypothetical protein
MRLDHTYYIEAQALAFLFFLVSLLSPFPVRATRKRGSSKRKHRCVNNSFLLFLIEGYALFFFLASLFFLSSVGVFQTGACIDRGSLRL